MYFSESQVDLRKHAFGVRIISLKIDLPLYNYNKNILHQPSNYQNMQQFFMMYWFVIFH